MLHVLDPLSNQDVINYTKPAILTRNEHGELWVRLEHKHASFVVKTKNALAVNYEFSLGDELLVTGNDFEQCYVIGVLNEIRHDALKTKQGATAKIDQQNSCEVLKVEDEHGHLLFEYDAENKKSKVYSPTGSLSFNAPNGDIEFLSANDIKCTSIGGIHLNSASAASVNVSSNKQTTSFNLTNQGALLNAKNVSVHSDQANVTVRNTLLSGQYFKSVLNHSKQVIEKIETIAKNIKQKSTNMYKDVEKLDQTRSGRMRTMVKNQMELKSQSAYIESKKSMNIDGEKINLG